MSILEITNPSDIKKEGASVLFVAFNTAPCRKFMNYARQAIGILESQGKEISYFQITNTPEVKKALNVSAMPTTIIYVDGEEKSRFAGHLWGQFEIAGKINGGINK